MAKDKGKDFDDQFNASKRRGQYKASRGEGAWSDDKYLERLNARLGKPPVHHASGESKSCADKTVALLAILGALAFLVTGGKAQADDTFPSQDACHVTSNNTPRGNCGRFVQVYAEDFGAQTVPVGRFSSCAGDGNFKCEGLRASYGRYYNTLGAYPDGWPDTAASGADGNSGPVPGYYRPQSTMSVIKQSNGDGQMRVRMTSDGHVNKVAAPVPTRCMNIRYGKFSERLVVRTATQGFKMAHLRYTPNEVDYPEAGETFQTDPVSEFTHGFKESNGTAASNSAWTSWHTYSTEIVPGQLRFYFDGRLFKTVNADFPDAADWVLQNESALGQVSGATPGSSVTIDTTWLSCYKYQ